MSNSFGFTVGICNACKGFVCISFSYLLQGDIIKYGLAAFYQAQG